MYRGEPCGRPLFGPLIDGISHCLMHTPAGKDEVAFQKEFNFILHEAGSGEADFTGFVFPSSDYTGREFSAHCLFAGAIFSQYACFAVAKFTQEVTFLDATFTQDADFMGANFMRDATFYQATFARNAKFGSAKFIGEAGFYKTKFLGASYFLSATFTQDASFGEATFTKEANFVSAAFAENAKFDMVTFSDSATFLNAFFMHEASFISARFAQDTTFEVTKFTGDAQFSDATFVRDTHFTKTVFTKCAFFGGAKFLGTAEFRETKFRKDEEGEHKELVPGSVFSLAEFSRPEAIIFYKTYLGQALFHNCDVFKLNFSSVNWRRRRSGKRMVFEEVVGLDDGAAEALRPQENNSDERDYGLIAELYQQLKKNYDERKDYWTAGDFHYGEMEMKRLHSQGKSGWTRWLNRNLGLVAWYKYASQYGESYVRPAVVLSIILVTFTLLFPWAGLDRNEDPTHSAPAVRQQTPAALSKLSYGHFKDFVGTYSGRRLGTAAFFGNSLMTVLSVAGFQKELKYEPSYPWGRGLALLELLLTSTLIALFLLAVRRQFKR